MADGLGSRLANMATAVTTGRPRPTAMRELGGAGPRGRRAQRSVGYRNLWPRSSVVLDRSLPRHGCRNEAGNAAMHIRDLRCGVVDHCKCRRREDPPRMQLALARVTSSVLHALRRALHQIHPRPAREGHTRRGVPVRGCQLTLLCMSGVQTFHGLWTCPTDVSGSVVVQEDIPRCTPHGAL